MVQWLARGLCILVGQEEHVKIMSHRISAGDSSTYSAPTQKHRDLALCQATWAQDASEEQFFIRSAGLR